jgi:hypothetical protein
LKTERHELSEFLAHHPGNAGVEPSAPEVATQASAALVCADSRPFAMLARQLRRALGSVDLLPRLPAAEQWSRYSLVAVHFDELDEAGRARLANGLPAGPGSPTVLVLSRKLDRSSMAALFGSKLLTNLLVIDDNGPDMADLLVTLQKLRRGDIFGLEKYFVWGVEPRVVTLRCSEDRFIALDAVNSYAQEIGIPGRLRAAIRTVTDEFLSNALYNAPVAPDGSARFAARSRTEPVTLEPGEEVRFQFCCDGRRFGLSVEDPFGSLSPQRLQENLSRAFRAGDDQVVQGLGGAGLGFYHILDALTHFIVDLAPGRRTELVGLIDVSSGYRKFAALGKSFNLFVTENSP